MTSLHDPVIIRTAFLNQLRTYREVVFLIRLAEAKIVFPQLWDSHQYRRGITQPCLGLLDYMKVLNGYGEDA